MGVLYVDVVCGYPLVCVCVCECACVLPSEVSNHVVLKSPLLDIVTSPSCKLIRVLGICELNM